MHITWDDRPHTPISAALIEPSGGITPERPHKLKKKVSFAATHQTSPETPAPTTPKTPKSPKFGGLSLFKKPHRVVSEPLPSTILAAGPPSPAASDDSAASWHHHDSYFPAYEPLFPSSTTVGKEWTSPYTTMLTPEEIRRQHHAAVLGSAVAVHYPDLPSWAEYTAKTGGDKDKAKVGWQSGKRGTEGWTGYGWDGETLPTADGTTFGAPMPIGVEIKPPAPPSKNKKKKKNNKGGGDEDAGGAADGGDEGEDGED